MFRGEPIPEMDGLSLIQFCQNMPSNFQIMSSLTEYPLAVPLMHTQ
jgi:hypothetical protein